MTRDACCWLFALGWISLSFLGCDAWIPATSLSTRRLDFGNSLDPSRRRRNGGATTTSFVSSSLYAALPEGYQEYGERVIRQAGNLCGLKNPKDLTVEWKAGRIVVTVHAPSYVSATEEEEGGIENDDIEYDDEYDEDEEENTEEDLSSGLDDDNDESTMTLDDNDDLSDDQVEIPSETEPSVDATPPQGIDVSVLARAINAALDDGGIGLAIAEVHEIEVTTPGASDELQGPIMFQAYKGFDVICRQEDPKTKKVKQVEGRLVERNDEFTIINVKGRIKKMKNSTVLSVKLPKAKKEKGK